MRKSQKIDPMYERDSENKTDSECEIDPEYRRDSDESGSERGVFGMLIAEPLET